MGCCRGRTAGRFMIILTSIFTWVAGMALFILGITLLINTSLGHGPKWRPMIVSIAQATGDWPYVVTYMLLAIGILSFPFSIVGCVAAKKLRHCLLVTYIAMLISLSVGTLFVGGLGVIYQMKLSGELRHSMQAVIYSEYPLETDLSARANDTRQSLGGVFEKFKCCGADSFLDFRQSFWFNRTGSLLASTRNIDNDELCAAPQCCVKKDSQELVADPSDINGRNKLFSDLADPKYERDFYYRNAKKCYSELCKKNSPRQLDKDYVHIMGCADMLTEWANDKFYYLIVICTIALLIELLAFFTALVFTRSLSSSQKLDEKKQQQ